MRQTSPPFCRSTRSQRRCREVAASRGGGDDDGGERGAVGVCPRDRAAWRTGTGRGWCRAAGWWWRAVAAVVSGIAAAAVAAVVAVVVVAAAAVAAPLAAEVAR